MLELKRLGHTPIAIAPTGKYLEKIDALGIKTVSYQISRKSLNPITEIGTIYNIYNTIKPLRLDILHTFTAKPNIYGTIAGKLARIPKIYNLVEGLGSFYLEEDAKSKLIRKIIESLYKFIFTLSNGVMFVNSSDPEYFRQIGIISSEKIYKIDGIGIDTSEWVPKEKKYSKEIVVVMVARAIKHKGTLEFIKAAQILKVKYLNTKFIYVGAPDSGNHSSINEELLINESSIEYLGERNDVKEILQNSDIFVLPSYREGLPRTVLEAMSLGLAVITTNAPGCKDVVTDGINGYLVPIKDFNALANAIEKLIVDEDLRNQMGNVGRQIALQRFDIAPVVNAHLKLYGITS